MYIYLFFVLLLFPSVLSAGALERVECFPGVLGLQKLNSEKSIRLYSNVKLEGEPVLTIADKLIFVTDKGKEEFDYSKGLSSKKIRDEVLEKFKFIDYKNLRYHVVFCPTEVEADETYYVQNGEQKLYFKLPESSIKWAGYGGSVLVEDFNLIKKFMNLNRYYKLKSKEFETCIQKKGIGCGNNALEISTRKLLFYFVRIKNGLCGIESEGGVESYEMFEVPEKFEVSNEIVKEAVDLINLKQSKNAEYLLSLTVKYSYRFIISAYVGRKHKCLESVGIDIEFRPPMYYSNQEKENMFQVIFPHTGS